jgi:hypothetical protein
MQRHIIRLQKPMRHPQHLSVVPPALKDKQDRLLVSSSSTYNTTARRLEELIPQTVIPKEQHRLLAALHDPRDEFGVAVGAGGGYVYVCV